MTNLQLCNLALIHLKAERIEGLNETSEQAFLCNQYLQTCIDDLLARDYSFTFAVHQEELEIIEDAVFREYSYVYRIPADCIRMREVVDGSSDSIEPCQLGLASDDSPLSIIYSRRINIVDVFPDPFSRAVAYRLAHTIGPGISPMAAEEIQGMDLLSEREYTVAITQDRSYRRLNVPGSRSLWEDA